MHRTQNFSLRRLLILSKNPLHLFPKPTSPIPKPTNPQIRIPNPNPSPTHFPFPIPPTLQSLRLYGNAREFDREREVDLINLKFGEAREEIEMALESKDTVYFDEEAHCARAAVKEVLDLFDSLSAKLSGDDRAALQRSMGLKIEQLKAELRQLDD